MPTKIKVFTVSKTSKYEERINSFLKDKIYIDIKFRDIDIQTMDIVLVYRERTIRDDIRDQDFELLNLESGETTE